MKVSTNRKRTLFFLCAGGLVAIAIWLFVDDPTLGSRAKRVPRREACSFISDHMETYSRRLQGATLAEALALLPEPDNTNRANVLVWKHRAQVVGELSPGDWRQLVYSPGDGLMLIFVDGKVATPLLAISADWDPWRALMQIHNMTEKEAEAVLGPQPAP
jgi:hypothetical protein